MTNTTIILVIIIAAIVVITIIIIIIIIIITIVIIRITTYNQPPSLSPTLSKPTIEAHISYCNSFIHHICH